MFFEYFAELGVPNKNRIVWSDKCLNCDFVDKSYGYEQLFCVVNLSAELGLNFSVEDGCLVGANSGKIFVDSLPHSEIRMPDYIDGKVRAKGNNNDFLAGFYYLDFRNGGRLYDRTKGLMAFGNLSEASITVRTCENLFISLDDCGKLVAVIVQL